jgi:hypothetical protein
MAPRIKIKQAARRENRRVMFMAVSREGESFEFDESPWTISQAALDHKGLAAIA